MTQVLVRVKKYVGIVATVAMIAVALPTVFVTSASATFGGRIGGEGGYVVTGTTSTLASGTANVTVKYLRKAGDYTNWKAWVWCNSGTGTWGAGVKQGANNASGACSSGAWIDLGTGYDSWGAHTSFTVTGVTNLVSFGIIVYSRLGAGDIVDPRDSQSANNRYFNVNGANTTAWLSDDGKDIFDGDPKPGYATYNYGTTTTSKFRIHYNRADNNYAGYYANLGFEQGSNGNYSYRNLANKASYQFQKAINFNGATTSSYGTYATGSDAFGPYVDFIPSTTWYTGGFTYLTVCISQSNTDNLGANGCADGDGGYRWLAPTFNTPGTQDLYIQSGTGISNSNPYALKPAISAVSPSPLSVSTSGGSSVTLTGANLTPVPNATPLIYVDGTVSVGTGTDSDSIATPVATIVPSAGFSGTSLTFTMPSLSAGSHTLYLGTAAGFSTGVAFTAAVPVPAPTILSLLPTSGLRGSTVAISGTGLDTISSVTVGGVVASIAPSPNATSATFTVPQGAGSGANSVVVTTSGGTATTNFTVLDAPTVSAVSPLSGLRGTTLTLTGTFLGNATSVTVGGAIATPDTNTATSITFKVPAGATSGLQSIAVTTAGGSASTNFTVLDVPAITSLSANSAVRGAPLTINGTGLQNATSVTVGGVTATITSNSSSVIGITVPASASPGPADIIVTSAGGTSNSQAFTVVADPPSVANVSPTSVPQGGQLTLTGTYLAGATVTIGGKNATVAVGASDSSLTVTVPVNASVGPNAIVVTTANGNDSTKSIDVTAGVPTITSVSPTAAARNADITITGTYFTDASSVTVGGVALSTFTIVNATTITGKVPGTAPLGSQSVVVTTPGGSATGSIIVLDVPTITSLSATGGKRGDSVTISGTSFAAVSAVKIGTVAVTSYTVDSLTSISAVVPVGALSGAQGITVTTSAGTSNSDKTFTVFDAPVISSVSPTSGLLGTSVTLTGTNLKPTSNVPTVMVGGSAATVTSSSATSVVITIPSGLAKNVAASIVLTNEGGTSNSDKTFTPVDAPAISSVAPTSAGRGATITITGTNLQNASSVTVNGATATIASSPSPNASSITVTVPESATSGVGTVVVTTPGGPSNGQAFTVLDIPTITSLNAISRSRGDQLTITGSHLNGATITIAGVTATPVASPSANSTSVTVTVPNAAPFGATTVVATTADGSSSQPFTVVGYYGTASLKIHYHRSDFDFAKTYIHAWLGAGGAGIVSGQTVGTAPGQQSPETAVTTDGVDSYGGVATVTVTGAADVQQICFLVWVNTTGNTFVKDTGSTPVVGYNGDRCFTLTSATSNEIWLENTSRTIFTSDPFAGILPSPNASATQTVTIHYDGDIVSYPYIYVGTRSELNTSGTNPYGYWVDARFYSFTSPTTVVGTTGTYTSEVGTDVYGKFVKFTLPYNAAHTTRLNMIVTSSDNWSATPPPTKDGGSTVLNSEGNRYLNLDTSGNTHVYLKSGDSTGDAAFATNPYPTPSIASLSATSGKAGDTVTITGTGLVTNGHTPIVTVGSATATPVSSPVPNSSSVAFTIPNGLTQNLAATVQLINSGGASNTNNTFTVIGPPTITSASPVAGLRGTTVTITGSGLTNVTDITIGDVKATPKVNDATSVAFVVPNDVASGLQIIAISTVGGSATTSFTVLDGPIISTVSPSVGPRGTSVTITGSYLTGASAVTFGGVAAQSYTVNSSTSITAIVPNDVASGAVDLVVTTAGGTASAAGALIVVDAPTISSLSQSSGPRGLSLTINGTFLANATMVQIGSVTATDVSDNSASALTITVPMSAVTGAQNISVTTAGGTATLTAGFTVVDAPTFAGIAPSVGGRGSSVTITGSNFTGATAVKFGGVSSVFTATNSTSISATVPADAATGNVSVSVTTAGGTVTATNAYTVVDAPVISTLSVNKAKRGTSVTITGTALELPTSVEVGGVAAVIAPSPNATSISITIPQAVTSGSTPIVVTTVAGTSNAYPFTVVDNPVISQVSASLGKRGDVITVTGQFLTGASFTIGGAVATTLSSPAASDTSATLSVPSDATYGAGAVVATTDGGIASLSYTVLTPPTISSLSASEGHAGDPIVITGQNFDNLVGVTLNGVSALVQVSPSAAPNDTSLTIEVPATTTGAIVITTLGGTVTSDPFTVKINVPTVNEITPTSVHRGDTVTVTGLNLYGTSNTLGASAISTTQAKDGKSLTFVVPADATLGSNAFIATTADSQSTAPVSINVLSDVPTITELSDTEVHRGDVVTVTGTNLRDITATFAGNSLQIVIAQNGLSFTFTVPGDATLGENSIVVTTSDSQSTQPTTVTVLADIPTLTSMSVARAHRGDTVVLTGVNLLDVTINVGEWPATITSPSPDSTSLSFVVPAGVDIGDVDITVVTSDEQESNSLTLKVLEDAPSLTSILPTNAYRGDTVTVSGINLTGTTFTFDGQGIEANINSPGSSATLTIPTDAEFGNRDIVVTTSDDQSASISVNIVPNPPTITALSAVKVKRGATINITGTNLVDATSVNFGALQLTTFTVNSSTSITVVVPNAISTGTVGVSVTTPGGVTGNKVITVIPNPPTITKFVQSKFTKRGFGLVTVTGTNLLGATVKIGTISATLKSGATSTKLVFVLPAKASATTAGQFTITTLGGVVKSVKTLKITIK